LALTDALTRTVLFGYDAADRVTTQTLPDTRTIGFGYDAGGNVTSLTPPGRPAHTFTYSAVDLTASYTPPLAVAGTGGTGYLFNADKQPTAIQRPDGQTTAFGYDSGGRLSAVTFSRGLLGYTYDTAGRVATLTDPGGVGLTFAYDGALPLGEAWSGPLAGAVTRTFSNDFDVATEKVNDAFEIAFGYDPDRLLTQAGALTIARDAATGLVTSTTLGTTTEAHAYNPFGESTRQTAQANGADVFDVQITRDALGRITQRIEVVVDGITRVFAYGYDLAGRLTAVERNGTLVVQYTYDANGNRLDASGEAGLVTATYDAQDRLLTYGPASYTYTANGELATKTTAGQTTTYAYDTLGNLITVTKPNGQVITYTVDGRGRRVRKAIDGVPVKGWLYADQLRPIAELDGSGAVVSRFVYGTRPNVPEYVVKNGETYRIVSDHIGTPRVVVHATTGVVVQRLDVQAFGEIIQDSAPGWQPFGFAGGLYDPDTGLLRFGARDYDPQPGRWTAKDPIGFGGGVSFYQYVDADPVNSVDSTGLAPDCGCAGAPASPSRADITTNVALAEKSRWLVFAVPRLWWFRSKVQNMAEWDYKQDGRQYQDFGNFNYGATGAAAGIQLQVLLRFAGWAQAHAGTSSPEWGTFHDLNLKGPFGDDPADQSLIVRGFNAYRAGCYSR
jgi:RHS repeat-associated protein